MRLEHSGTFKPHSLQCFAPPDMSSGFSALAYSAFSTVFRPWLKSRFSQVDVRTPHSSIFPDIPIMVVANHVSWWDGFLLMELHRQLRPRAPFHAVMLESELAKHPFLRLIGAIGIDPHSPSTLLSAIRELSRRVEKRPDSMIFFFPQGKIWPSHRRPLGFKRGVEVFYEALRDVVVLPVAIHIEPLNRVAPYVFVHSGEPIQGDSVSAATLERRVEEQLDHLLSTLTQYGEDAPAFTFALPTGSSSSLRKSPRSRSSTSERPVEAT